MCLDEWFTLMAANNIAGSLLFYAGEILTLAMLNLHYKRSSLNLPLTESLDVVPALFTPECVQSLSLIPNSCPQ